MADTKITLEPTTPAEAGPLGPEAEPTPSGPPTSALAAALAEGSLRLRWQRGTGTLRALPYLADGTPAREVATYFQLRREEGASVAAIAADTGTSRATVRRALTALALTEAVEDGDLDELLDEDTLAAGELVLGGLSDEDGAE